MSGETQRDLDEKLAVAVLDRESERAIQLLDEGADVNARAPSWRQSDRPTVLMMASRSGQKEVVMKLLAGKADVNATTDDHAWTALSAASEGGYIEIVAALLNAGANVNSRGAGGQTPLMMASMYGHVEVQKLLLAHRADSKAREIYEASSARASDHHLYNAEELAAREGHHETVETLRRAKTVRKWWKFWR